MSTTSILTVASTYGLRRGDCLGIEGQRFVIISVCGTSVEIGPWRWWHSAEFWLRRFARWASFRVRLAVRALAEVLGG